MTTIDNAIYSKDKNSTTWEEYIDLDRLVRFYIVQEILDNAESFHGSCYMHRNLGENEKWLFGPGWDFGNTFRRGGGQFIYENPPYGQTWIAEIAKFPRFQEKVKEIWLQLRENNFNEIYTYIDNYVENNEAAIQADDVRWPDYGSQNVKGDGTTMKNNIRERVAFLAEHWGDVVQDVSPTSYTVYFTAEGTNWSNVNAYSWDYNGSVTEFLGNWPGTKLTQTVTIDNKQYYTLTFDPGYTPTSPMIIFNDGKSGVGEHQTEDLVLENNTIYNLNGKMGTYTSIHDITKGQDLHISHRTLSCSGHIALYNMQGILVAQGDKQVTAPAAGIYIVVTDYMARKVVVR